MHQSITGRCQSALDQLCGPTHSYGPNHISGSSDPEALGCHFTCAISAREPRGAGRWFRFLTVVSASFSSVSSDFTLTSTTAEVLSLLCASAQHLHTRHLGSLFRHLACAMLVLMVRLEYEIEIPIGKVPEYQLTCQLQGIQSVIQASVSK